MTILPERSVTLTRSRNAIERYFSRQNIQIKHDNFGNTLSATVTLLNRESGTKPISGCGKGYAEEASVGALYEAYEHYRSFPALREKSRLYPFWSVIQQAELRGMLPLTILAKSSPAKIAAVEFTDKKGCASLLWPLFLTDCEYFSHVIQGDTTDYSAARRYTSNAGIAAGYGFTEAAIHAIGEIIERHCTGILLAKTFFYDVQKEIRLVNTDSLPPVAEKLFNDAQSALEDEINIIDASEPSLPPVYLAYCKSKPRLGINIYGAGCSLYADHAVTRAIKELVQLHKLADNFTCFTEELEKHQHNLREHEKLYRSLVADFGSLASVSVDLPEKRVVLTLQEHLHRLTTLCEMAGLPVWLKEIDSDPAGVSLACAVMPGMERFALVSLGNVVIPCRSYQDQI